MQLVDVVMNGTTSGVMISNTFTSLGTTHRSSGDRWNLKAQ